MQTALKDTQRIERNWAQDEERKAQRFCATPKKSQQTAPPSAWIRDGAVDHEFRTGGIQTEEDRLNGIGCETQCTNYRGIPLRDLISSYQILDEQGRRIAYPI